MDNRSSIKVISASVSSLRLAAKLLAFSALVLSTPDRCLGRPTKIWIGSYSTKMALISLARLFFSVAKTVKGEEMIPSGSQIATPIRISP